MSPTSEESAPPEEGSHASQNGAAVAEATLSTTTVNDIPHTANRQQRQTTEAKFLSESQIPAKSPKTSREGSPIRPQTRQSVSGPTQRSRSRKSSQEFSPTRSATMSSSFASIPSAAAVQRALSANKSPISSASVDGVLEGSRPDKSVRSGDNSPHWPISPRLRSPPPSSSTSRSSIPILRKTESDNAPASAALKRSAASSTSDIPDYFHSRETDRDEVQLRTSLRTPGRGVNANASGLETVAEGSLPNTPAAGPLLNMLGDQSLEARKLDGKEVENLTKNQSSSTADRAGSGTDGTMGKSWPSRQSTRRLFAKYCSLCARAVSANRPGC